MDDREQEELLVSLEDARARCLPFYFTGVPCKRGGVAKRATSTFQCLCSACVEFRRVSRAAIGRKYRQSNPGKVQATQRQYRRANRTRINERERDRRVEKRALGVVERSQTPAYKLANYLKNREAQNAARRQRYQLERSKLKVQAHARRVRRRGTRVRDVPSEFLDRLLRAQSGQCNGCLRDISASYTVDHIIALARGGEHAPENLQLLCLSCNSSKQSRTWEEWAVFVERRHGKPPRLPVRLTA